MSALRDGSEKLEAALARLEAVVADRGAGTEELRVAVAQARAENARLQALANEAADRLDRTIAQLERAMKEA
ncbi:MAG: hypothetical protein WD341_08140 [Tistlia sp.]|uniref:hypothetical protein n=1 Tax=Tistlia sp. TaxID=3057121 RepID=UPI0034A101A1